MTKLSARLFKNLFAVALLGGLLCLVDVHKLWEAFSNLTIEAIFNLLLLSVVLVYISALKWSYFLRALAEKVSVLRLFCLYLVGYFINLLVPSYVGGDVVRSFYVGKKVGQHQALTATILERYTGMVAMLVLALLGMWFSELATWQIKLMVVFLALLLASVTALALSTRTLAWLGKIRRLKEVVGHLQEIQAGFHLVRQDFPLLLKAMALSFLYHSFTVVNTVIAAKAVGWETPSYAELFVVLPLILLIGSLPVSPSGLGLQEGAFFYFLQGIGATPAQALGIGLVLRAKTYLMALIGGGVWLAIGGAGGKPEKQQG